MVKIKLKVKLGSLENVVIANKAKIKNVEKNIAFSSEKVATKVDEYEAEM